MAKVNKEAPQAEQRDRPGCYRESREVEGTVLCLLEFDNGAMAVLQDCREDGQETWTEYL